MASGSEGRASRRSVAEIMREAVEAHGGDVIVGLDAGEAVSVEGGYRGGALNLAARLCGKAAPGEILASQAIVHLARATDGWPFTIEASCAALDAPSLRPHDEPVLTGGGPISSAR